MLGLMVTSGLASRYARAECLPSTQATGHDAPAAPRSGRTIPPFDTESAIARDAMLQHELALTSERLRHRKQELRWMLMIIALAGIVVALLTSMLIANWRYRRELLRLAHQDTLTGLPNRRCTRERAAAALASARHRPMTIALIDLDHFKSINDRCGHSAGDRVLLEFARLTREVLRATDTLGRWGGEGFCSFCLTRNSIVQWQLSSECGPRSLISSYLKAPAACM